MSSERAERFRAETGREDVAGSARGDAWYQAVGLVLAGIGVVGAVVLGLSSRAASDGRDIETNIIYALGFLGLTLVGIALFLRYSLARFLRIWLLRQIYEIQSNTDQVLDAFRRG